MNILIFKTNIRHKKNFTAVASCLDSVDGIIRWNVDLHDRDNILRVEARDLSPRMIEHTLLQAGYFCEELPD